MQFRILFFVCYQIAFTNAFSQEVRLKPDSSILFEVTRGKDLLKDCSGSYYQTRVDSFWTPSQPEYDNMQANFYKENKLGHPISEYAIQYLGVWMKGEKFIYINAFPKYQLSKIISVHKNLTTTAVVACGGGSLYWRALFNYKLKEFSNMQVNAPM